jgi:hypothetical protein
MYPRQALCEAAASVKTYLSRSRHFFWTHERHPASSFHLSVLTSVPWQKVSHSHMNLTICAFEEVMLTQDRSYVMAEISRFALGMNSIVLPAQSTVR